MRHFAALLVALALAWLLVTPLRADDADEIKRLTAENAALKAKVAELQNELQWSTTTAPAAKNAAKPGSTGSAKLQQPPSSSAPAKGDAAAELEALRARRDTLNAGLYTAVRQLYTKLKAVPPVSGETSVQKTQNVATIEGIRKAADFSNYTFAGLARVADVSESKEGFAQISIADLEFSSPLPDVKFPLQFSPFKNYYLNNQSASYSVLASTDTARLIHKGQPVLIIVNRTIYHFGEHGGLVVFNNPLFVEIKFSGDAVGQLCGADYVLQIGDRLYESPWRHSKK